MTSAAPTSSPAASMRGRIGHVWGEVWRFALAALGGVIMFGTRVGTSATPGVIEVGDATVGEATPGDISFTSAPVSDAWLNVDLIVGLLVLGLLLFRRRWPLPVAALAVASAGLSSFSVVTALICVVSIATRRRRQDLLVLVPVFAASLAVNSIFWPVVDGVLDLVASLFINTVLFGAAWAWGAYRGARRDLVASLRERATTLEREQGLRVAQARTAERSRIAQEMHDVLAHRISLIAVHANALSFRSDLPPAQVAEHAGVIRDNAQHAVAELREVLGVLRGGEGDATAPPQPTLAQLPALLEDAQRAGTRVAAIGAMPEFDDLPEATSRTAYRIVQECLTNARKHATGLPVTLQIGGTEGVDLTIVVSNPLPGADATASIEGTGMGLLGLAERVELAGGNLSHTVEDGFFVVRAHLPWSS